MRFCGLLPATIAHTFQALLLSRQFTRSGARPRVLRGSPAGEFWPAGCFCREVFSARVHPPCAAARNPLLARDLLAQRWSLWRLFV